MIEPGALEFQLFSVSPLASGIYQIRLLYMYLGVVTKVQRAENLSERDWTILS